MNMSWKKAALIGLAGLGLAAASAGSASAYVVCNRYGDCWHTDQRYRYDPEARVQFHEDDWYFHQRWDRDHNRHFRDWHDGRGYWRNGVWISF